MDIKTSAIMFVDELQICVKNADSQKQREKELFSYRKRRWVAIDSLEDFMRELAAHPHYNPDDAVQQFMNDVLKELRY